VAENALVRQKLIILRRQVNRQAFTRADRMVLVLLTRAVQTWKQALFIVQPETLLHWHRVGFHWFWKRKSKRTSPKPKLAPELIILIKEMAKNNRLWGAERICGELLKLDIRVCKRTIQFPERMTQVASTGRRRNGRCFVLLYLPTYTTVRS